jgi:hypothetical protein
MAWFGGDVGLMASEKGQVFLGLFSCGNLAKRSRRMEKDVRRKTAGF